MVRRVQSMRELRFVAAHAFCGPVSINERAVDPSENDPGFSGRKYRLSGEKSGGTVLTRGRPHDALIHARKMCLIGEASGHCHLGE